MKQINKHIFGQRLLYSISINITLKVYIRHHTVMFKAVYFTQSRVFLCFTDCRALHHGKELYPS